MLNLDISLFIVFGLVWLLMVILNKLFYQPVGDLLTEREEKMVAETQEIQKQQKALVERTQQLEDILHKARRDSLKLEEEIIREGERVKGKTVEETRSRAKEILKEKMVQLERDIQTAETKLRGELQLFSEKIDGVFND